MSVKVKSNFGIDSTRDIQVRQQNSDDVHFQISQGMSGIQVSAEDAHAIADWIKANIPLPPKPTQLDQYLALAPGTQFKFDRFREVSYIKVTNRYLFKVERDSFATVAEYSLSESTSPLYIISEPGK